MDAATSVRFWSRVNKLPGGCWLWAGYRDEDGYGMFGSGSSGTRYGAHIHAWEDANGPVPAGLELDHLCRVRHCVNPSHLEPVTHKENCLRGTGPIPENATKTECVNGHPFNDANTYWRPGGHRDCRACINERARRYRGRLARAKKAA